MLAHNRLIPLASIQVHIGTLPHVWHRVLRLMGRHFQHFPVHFRSRVTLTNAICISLDASQSDASIGVVFEAIFRLQLQIDPFLSHFRPISGLHFEYTISDQNYPDHRVGLHVCAKFQPQSFSESKSPGANTHTNRRNFLRRKDYFACIT
jgi:hypothetical protein